MAGKGGEGHFSVQVYSRVGKVVMVRDGPAPGYNLAAPKASARKIKKGCNAGHMGRCDNA